MLFLNKIFLELRASDKSASFCSNALMQLRIQTIFSGGPTNLLIITQSNLVCTAQILSSVSYRSMQIILPHYSHFWRSSYYYSQWSSGVLNYHKALHSSGLTDFPKFAVQFLWLQYSERLSSSRRNRSRIYPGNIHTGFLIKSAHSRLQVVQLICQVMTVYVIHECTIILRL